jgi:hypothetical protein
LDTEATVKLIVVSILPLLPAVFYTIARADGESNNYFLFRGVSPETSAVDYRTLSLSYTFHYEPSERAALHLAVRKGSGEKGYYPAGYSGDADSGFYERGSYSLALSDLGAFNRIIVGNYNPLFGQGLLFGGTYPVSLKNPYFEASRHRDGINPASSASKAGVLEGIAAEYRLKTAVVRPFFSWNSFDCSAGESDYYLYNDNDGDGLPNHPQNPGDPDPDPDDFTGRGNDFPAGYSCKTELFQSLREEPEYDAESARAKRNNLTEYLAGVNVSARKGTLRAGGTLVYAWFDRLVDPYYSYDPDKGNKTGYYFRGRDYAAASVYFKSYGTRFDTDLEYFGEAVGTLYRRMSYYPEFNGDLAPALGFSTGLKKAFDRSGILVWGAYMPASLVNPHGQEFPDGANNLAYGLVGYQRARGERKAAGRLLFYRQLYNKDDPDEPETKVSAFWELRHPWGKKVLAGIEQELVLVDNYYSELGMWSWKQYTELSSAVKLRRSDALTFSLESRAGGSAAGPPAGGVGVSAELVTRRERSGTAFRLMGYTTDDAQFGVLYPYERPLFSWSLFAPALRGLGLYGYALLTREVGKASALGGKVRWVFDARDAARSAAAVSVYGEAGF